VRFQYAICYPADLLVPQGEAPNGDGQRFLAKDGAQLTVFGQHNVLAQTPGELMAATASRLAGASGRTTYQVRKPGWFVVSGYDGPTKFYAKTRYGRQDFKSFELTYDRTLAAIYEPLLGRLGACFTDLAG
jgi:hypothetical protein